VLDAHGNKAQAAKALGISRATIYRRIHEFGIVTPAHGGARFPTLTPLGAAVQATV
jgi:predicted DNA-binding transcriptional regulator AlpA